MMGQDSIWRDFKDFFIFLVYYSQRKVLTFFGFFERVKSSLAARLYFQRGRYVRPFLHSGMAFLVIGGIVFGPTLIAESFSHTQEDLWQGVSLASTVSASIETQWETSTLRSIKPRADLMEYTVKPGDTVSTIADKFGISVDTIRWVNDLETVKTIKAGTTLKIPPVTGIWIEKVKHGETIYSLAKKYQVSAQGMVDWPFNSFANDEIFALAVGQSLMIPDGVMPKAVPVQPRYYAQAPAAGEVTGTGQFSWPTSGRITQDYRWYHKGIDIANKSGSTVSAADSGTVILVGWPSPWAYGNRVIVDHGNGYSTLYAHLSSYGVGAGQKVSRGQVIGRMGSTGRSTGIHLHFEIRKNGAALNPMNFLK